MPPDETPIANPERRPPTVVLVGFMGAGKTTVGRRLAALLGRRFVDTDEEVVRAAGRAISSIFDQEGEAGFRRRESAALARALGRPGRVVALGGGALTVEENRARLRGSVVVYLEASPPTLEARLAGDGGRRPLLAEGFPHDLLGERRPLYETADLRLDTERRTPEEAAEAIRDWLVRSGRGEPCE